MRASLAILAMFVLGLVLGRSGEMPLWLLDEKTALHALWLFMFLAGLSIGIGKNLRRLLKNVHGSVLLLPCATTIGTFAGVSLAAPLLALPAPDCLAVGAGFGYYSLSSILISQCRGADLGTIALLANILRELIALVFMPLLVAWFGPRPAIACGGCTTMDTTLPVITRYAGSDYVLPAIIHAILLDLSVPFWVALFCSL